MLATPRCYERRCRYFLGVAGGADADVEVGERVVCRAFDDGIPATIAYGDNLHAAPLPGQENDLVFEPLGADEDFAA